MRHKQSRRWDVFLSYARSDADQVSTLTAMLRDHGLTVFVDETDITGFSSLDSQLRNAIASSTVLLAFYSKTYPSRPSCQFELMTAFLAGQREGDPRRRVAVVNPDEGQEHILPKELRDIRHWNWPCEADEAKQLLHSVADQADSLSAPIGEAPSQVPGFVGRHKELWQLHTALTEPAAPQSTTGGSRTCVLTGITGSGKTALAHQYQALFGSAFSGGISWTGLDDTSTPAPDSLTILDTPSGTSPQRISHWLRNRLASTANLVITDRHLNLPTDLIALPGLDQPNSLAMLTGFRIPANDEDAREAQHLINDLGGHPQALLLSGAAIRSLPIDNSYKVIRRAWLSGRIHSIGITPADNPDTNLITALTHKVSTLDQATMDITRILSTLPNQLCFETLLEAVWGAAGNNVPVTKALESAARHNLCVRSVDGYWQLEPLVRLLVRQLETDPSRRQHIERVAWLTTANYPETLNDAAGGSMSVSTPSQVEQEAAFRLQVELASRITTIPLADEDGFLREALTSMKTVLQTARESLTSLAAARRGTEVVSLVREVINEIRPLLSRWHPLLAEHESLRPGDVGVRTHERNWEHNAELRRELAELQERLREIEGQLEDLTGTQLSFG